MKKDNIIYIPKNINDIINLLQDDIEKLDEEIKTKNNMRNKLYLYKLYLEKIQNKE